MGILVYTLASYGQYIRINELASSNLNINQDEDGDYKDWIELYNPGDSSVNLEGYSLSDDASDPARWKFPSVTLEPGAHLLVWASGKDRSSSESDYDMGLQREVYNGIVGERIAQLVNFSKYPFTPNTEEIYAGDFEVPQDVGDNYGQRIHGYILAPSTGEYTFWISGDNNCQLFLSSSSNKDEAVLIAETPEWTGRREWTKYSSQKSDKIYLESGRYYYISALMKEGTGSDHLAVRWQMPDNTIEEPIPNSRLYYSDSELHTNFKLKASGEELILSDASGHIIDRIGPAVLPCDISWGRFPDGSDNWNYFYTPTPAARNLNKIYYGQCEDPVFTMESGFYATPDQAYISTEDPNLKIYYTTDGAIPTEQSTPYLGGIIIDKTSTIRARSFSEDLIPSRTFTKNYFIGEDYSFPVVSVTTDPYNLYDSDYGLFPYSNPYWESNLFQDWERPANIQLFETDQKQGFELEAGIKVHGGLTRGQTVKSLAVMARSKYGASKINYKIFKDKELSSFNNIVLRNGGNDCAYAIMRDAFMHAIIRGEMDLELSSSRPAVVYLNGNYWGVHDIREKLNEHFIAGNRNIDPDNIDLLEYVHYSSEVQEVKGSAGDFNALIGFIRNHDLSQADNYEVARQEIDIENYMEYLMSQIYVNNRDWPGNNIKWWRQNAPAGKWRWLLFDTDFGFNFNPSGNTAGDISTNYMHNTLAWAANTSGGVWPNYPHATSLFLNLLRNEAFKNQFINTFCDHLNTTFQVDRVKEILDDYQYLYQEEIERHRLHFPSSVVWLHEIEAMRVFAELRPQYIYPHLMTQFGLSRNKAITLDIDNPDRGSVGINSLICSRYPWVGEYFPYVPVKIRAIPEPGFRFAHWSDGNESQEREIDVQNISALSAFFEPASLESTSIVISEINYNSASESGSDDWVELYNHSDDWADISLWTFKDSDNSNGFTFPYNTLIEPNGALALCKDMDRFLMRYSEDRDVIGNMNFGFSSRGESLSLYDNRSNLIDWVPYGVSAPWPDSANTKDRSIVLIDPAADNSLAENWIFSEFAEGSPGEHNYTVSVATGVMNQEYASGLRQNYPNPFYSGTTIDYEINQSMHVMLQIVDLNGQTLRTLVNHYHQPGQFSYAWDGKTANGHEVSGQVFFCRMITSDRVETIKMIRVR